MPASPSMKVIADSHDAVLTNPLSRVTAPVCARSLEMSIPRSPSVPTIMGNSVSSLPMRSTAGGSLIVRLLLVRVAAYPSTGKHLPAGRTRLRWPGAGGRTRPDAGGRAAVGAGHQRPAPMAGRHRSVVGVAGALDRGAARGGARSRARVALRPGGHAMG